MAEGHLRQLVRDRPWRQDLQVEGRRSADTRRSGAFRGRLVALVLYHIASPFADVEWDEEAIDGYKGRLDRLTRSFLELHALDEREGLETIDHWLLSGSTP